MASTLKLLLQLLLTLLPPLLASAASPTANTCLSVECVSLAANMAGRMNISADPCHDFYNYACGNFPNEVKYNPLKAEAMSSALNGEDFLFEDTIGLMTDKIERNIYEMLVLDRVVTSKDADMFGLYNFTRLFYRSCRRWMQRAALIDSRYRRDPEAAPFQSVEFLRGVYAHLNQTMQQQARVGVASFESSLAALVRTGGQGILRMGLPKSFAEDVIREDDLRLTKTARARVHVGMDFKYYGTKSKLKSAASLLENVAPKLKILKRFDHFISTYLDLYGDLQKPWASENCTVSLTKGKYTVAELDSLATCASPSNPFSWAKFFKELVNNGVNPAALVEVLNLKQVMNFMAFFKSRQNTTSFAETTDEAFLIFDWLLSFASFFPKELQKELSEKPQAIEKAVGEGVTACMMWTKDLLQPIVERMYQRAYHREDFQDIKQFVQLIKTASIESMKRQSWITASAKVAIAKKIQSMKQTIGLDDLTAGQLKSFYNETLAEFRVIKLQPNSLESSFGSLMSLAVCAYTRKNLEILSGGSPVSLFMDINPLVVNAFNWIEKNEIIFPMAILAPPMYHPNYPHYVNLGSLGYIIGHEIGHSFDNMGHTINQKGASGHFWDSRTEEGYVQRMECVRSSYSKYTLYPGGPTHSSNGTLGNDIADIMGIKAAAEALKMLKRERRARPMPRLPNLPAELSPERVLFVHAAQSWCLKSEPHVLRSYFGGSPSHSPHHLRIRGIAENSPEFAEAFNCPRGRPMNPAKKCTFW